MAGGAVHFNYIADSPVISLSLGKGIVRDRITGNVFQRLLLSLRMIVQTLRFAAAQRNAILVNK